MACPSKFWRLLLALLALGAAPGAAGAAELVAPYVNSPQEDVELMLDMADAGPGDYVIDLGAGDGRIVITAALRGAAGHGVELDRELVELARRRARAAEVDDRAAFRHGDVFEADLRGATIVTLYLMPEVNLRLRPKLLAELPPGTRVLSNSFDMGDWQPDRRAQGRTSGGILMWIVPAAVAGTWHIEAGDGPFELEIAQQFQRIDMSLRRDGRELHVLDATLSGERIAFSAGDGHTRYVFSGRADGGRLSGVMQAHGVDDTRIGPWQAVRTGGG